MDPTGSELDLTGTQFPNGSAQSRDEWLHNPELAAWIVIVVSNPTVWCWEGSEDVRQGGRMLRQASLTLMWTPSLDPVRTTSLSSRGEGKGKEVKSCGLFGDVLILSRLLFPLLFLDPRHSRGPSVCGCAAP